jgi:adenylate cyclase
VSRQIADICSDEFLFRASTAANRKVPEGRWISSNFSPARRPEEYRVNPAVAKLVRDWNEVYEVYASQDWLRTLDALEAFADEHPEDVVAGIYLDRVVEFLLELHPITGVESSASARR